MIFIHSLRMLADLSVYFFIAELVTVSLGASSQFVQFLLLGASYGLAVFMQSRNYNKIFMLLPLAVLFLPGSYPLALIPPVAYITYLLYKEDHKLSWDRQSELFSITVKFFPITGVVICFLGYSRIVVQYSLPMAFVSFVTSIFPYENVAPAACSLSQCRLSAKKHFSFHCNGGHRLAIQP